MAEDAEEAQLEAFIEKWALDPDAVLLLKELEPVEQAKALTGFTPHANTPNISAKFANWLRGASRREGGSAVKGRGLTKRAPKQMPIGAAPSVPSVAANAPPGLAPLPQDTSQAASSHTSEEMEALAGPEAVAAFVENWGLDDDASTAVTDLPVGVRLAVLQGFSPGAKTRNVGGRLKAYVRLKSASNGNSKLASVVAVPEEALSSFIEKWSLDAQASEWLRQLPADVLEGVLSTFNPPGETRNMTGRLKAFTKHRLIKQPNTVLQFVTKWRLDAESEALLASLQPNVLDVVLSEFEPPHGTGQVGANLASFCRMVAKRRLGGSSAVTNGRELAWSSSHTFSTAPSTLQPQASCVGQPGCSRPPLRGSGGQVAHPAADAIGQRQRQRGVKGGPSTQLVSSARVEKLGLNDEAEQALWNLPPKLQAQVLAEFDTPIGTVNVSGKFLAFVRHRVPSGRLSTPARVVPVASSGKVSRQRVAVGAVGAIGAASGNVYKKQPDKAKTRQVKEAAESSRGPPPGLAATLVTDSL